MHRHVQYEIAIDQADALVRSLGRDPQQENVGDLLYRQALSGDETALRCPLREVHAAAAVEAVEAT